MATKLERLPEVRDRTGLSRAGIYKAIREGRFPAQIKIGERASAWDSEAVDTWIAERIAASKKAA